MHKVVMSTTWNRWAMKRGLPESDSAYMYACSRTAPGDTAILSAGCVRPLLPRERSVIPRLPCRSPCKACAAKFIGETPAVATADSDHMTTMDARFRKLLDTFKDRKDCNTLMLPLNVRGQEVFSWEDAARIIEEGNCEKVLFANVDTILRETAENPRRRTAYVLGEAGALPWLVFVYKGSN
jgi:hypothetical protein